MLGIEAYPTFLETETYKEQRKQWRGLINALGGAPCDIDLMGVSHTGRPPLEILNLISESDVVLLELPRTVVKLCLDGKTSNLLERNEFWRLVIDYLKYSVERQKVEGAEVNRDAQIAWKRTSLHYGYDTLAPSPLTFELDDVEHIENLQMLLSEEDIQTLKKYSWLVTNNPFSAEEIGIIEDSPDGQTSIDGLRLACKVKDVASMTGLSIDKVTFMISPDLSIKESYYMLCQIMEGFDWGDIELGDEIFLIGMELLCTFLLTPGEFSETKEMAYAAKQFANSNPTQIKQHGVRVLHIGGAYHTPTLEKIIQDTIEELEANNVQVHTHYDPRITDEEMDNLAIFYRKNIPYLERLYAVRKIKGQITLDRKSFCRSVSNMIFNNYPEFIRLVIQLQNSTH